MTDEQPRRVSALWARFGPRTRDVLFILLSLPFALDAYFRDRPAGPYAKLGYVVAVVGTSVVLWWRRSAPVTVTLLGVPIWLTMLNPVPLAAGLFTTAVRRRDRVLLAMAALTAAAFAYVMYDTTQAQWEASAFVGVVSAALCAALGAFIGARVDLVASLTERARRAEAERELRAEQARTAERARIAQEMHDVLAHKVSLIALHAGALEMRAGDGSADVQQSAGVIRTTAREAMEDLRDVLGVLRGGAGDADELRPQPGLADIERLVEASRGAGVQVDLTVVVDHLPDAIARTAFRVVQEALTNVHKHARGAATKVGLVGDRASGLTISVANCAPVSAATLLPGSGAGLVGLRERVGLLGGTLTAGPDPSNRGGWLVRAWMPWTSSAGATS